MFFKKPQGLNESNRRFWDENGYLVLSGLFRRREIRNAVNLLENMWTSRHRADNPLVVDVGLNSAGRRKYLRDAEDADKSTVYKLNDAFLVHETVRDLCLKPALVGVLKELVDGDVCVCNSLHFERGSQQALHVDTFYMPPPADGVLIATSICLEDVHPDAGPLNYVAGTHRLPPYLNSDGGRNVRSNEEQDQANWYYRAAVADRNMSDELFLGRAGDVIIWHEQLLHGGSPIKDITRTRKSLVTHYWRCAEMDPDVLLPHGAGFYLNRPHQQVV